MSSPPAPNVPAAAFTVESLLNRRAEFDSMGYLEFFRNSALNAGIYVLPVGATDTQTPHDEDEIYYVLSGRGQLRIEEPSPRDMAVKAGTLVFLARNIRHYFHSVSEELKCLVVFSAAK